MLQTPTKSNRPSPPSTPRWVKVFGIIGVVLLSIFAILHLTGNSPFGDHMATVQLWLQRLWR
jgi:hypothetical protein